MAATIADERILTAALDVIIQHGYAGATTREMAAAAGINEVTLFRRFGNKERLLSAVVEREAQNFATADIKYSGDIEADLWSIVRFYSHLMQESGPVIAMIISEIPRHPELMSIMQTPFQIMTNLAGVLGRYQDEGVLIKEPPMDALAALLGPLFLKGVIGSIQPGVFDGRSDEATVVHRFLEGRRA